MIGANTKTNKPAMIFLVLGLITIAFPLYLTVVIAFKQPSEMTNSISGILSLPSSWSLENFREAMRVTDFWNSLGNSLFITLVTVALSIVIHSMIGYAIGRNKAHSTGYNLVYLYIVSGMFVPFAILMMPLVKQTAQMGLNNRFGVILLYVVFYMPMNVEYSNCTGGGCLRGWSKYVDNLLEDRISDHASDACDSSSSDSAWNME